MDEKTLEALRLSVRHWEQNAAADDWQSVSVNSSECALCSLYFSEFSRLQTCRGCPVYAKTQKKSCRESPYVYAVDAWVQWKNSYLTGASAPRRRVLGKKFREAAQAEVAFLRGLLPDEESAECR